MTVRRAVAEDAARLPAVERSAGEAFRASPHAWIADDQVAEPSFHAPLIAAGSVWVADVEGELGGFVTCELIADELHIWELAVALPHQRRGVGRELVAVARNHAEAMGLAALTLTTFTDVEFNAPFYARLGFTMPDPASPRLQAILASEAARGLTNRCAMRLALQRSGGA